MARHGIRITEILFGRRGDETTGTFQGHDLPGAAGMDLLIGGIRVTLPAPAANRPDAAVAPAASWQT